MKYRLNSFSFWRRMVFFGGLLIIGSGGFYFLNIPAKTQGVKNPAEQNLVNGRLAFSRRDLPNPAGWIVTSNQDGSGRTTLTATSTQPTLPAWSPDGTKIAFNSAPGDGDIFVMDANGSGLTNLTNTAESETNSSWSVNGKIAYERRLGTGGVPQIWTMNADGSGQTQFSAITQPSPTRPAWSPDGMKLAFSSGGEIWVINANGTNELRLTMTASTDTDPAWSPDGLKIVFVKGGNGISVINADGSNEIPLAGGGGPAWSPDGTKIAYRGSSGIWTMDASGTNQVRIITDVINFPQCCDSIFENPAWQPVAQPPNTFIISGQVTYDNLPVSGVTVNLSGTTNAALTTDAVGNYQFSGLAAGGNYTVSPSFIRYYFTPPNRSFNNLASNQTGNFEVLAVCPAGNCVKNGKIAFVRSADIFTMNNNGTNQTNITNNGATDGAPNWSPDGSTIIFSTNRDGNSEIYRMNNTGVNPVNLTNNPAGDTSPYYSSDGRSIVFVSGRDGNGEIYKMNADGTNQVRLTNDAAHQGSPAFSPDGQKIVFTVAQFQMGMQLWSMNADGSNQQRFPDSGGLGNYYNRPSYSPDGTKILFRHGPDPTLPSTWTMNADGTNRVQFSAGNSPSYSPDGKKVVHVCCNFDFTNRIHTVNTDGSSPQILTASETGTDFPDWQPLPAPRPAPYDFDGDGRSDISVFRPSNGVWYQLRSTSGFLFREWGLSSDLLAPADYDGDLKTDLAVWRPSDGNFYVVNSFDNTIREENFGLSGDVPTGGDWDGDGKADVAIYRDGRPQHGFHYRGSMGNPNGNVSSIPWGAPGDKPVAGDYDGDGRTDAAVFRPSTGTWYVRSSSNGGVIAVNFGLANDKLVPADYDGDGKTDFAVFRDGVWYLLRSAQGFTGFQFGTSNDIPATADYDGDGRADAAIYRNGVWWILDTQTGAAQAVQFGQAGDVPIPSAYVR